MHDYLMDVLIFLVAAVVTVPIFKRLRIGAILAYLFAGLLMGPEMLGFVKDPHTILSFSELGVVLLLFLIGLELNPARLWSMRRNVFGLGLLQVLLTGLIFTFLANLFGISWQSSTIIGFGLALSSTAFGIQLLDEKRQLKTLHGQGSFSILLFQDLAVVPLIALIPLLSGDGAKSLSLGQFTEAMAIIIAVVLLGRYAVRWWFRLVAESGVQEIFVATSLLVVLGTAMAMEHIGLSMGMGAFLAGMMLANSEYRHELETNLQPFKGLLMGLFFMAVGMSLDLSSVLSRPHVVLGITLAFMGTKSVIIYGLSRSFGFPNETSRNMAFTLPQGGEFAFVLFAAASGAGLLSSESTSLLNTSVTISMALTPLVFGLNQRFLRTFSEISERPSDFIPSAGAKVIIAGYGRFGQVVARFLRSRNISTTILEHSATQVDTARKFGAKIYYGNAARADIVESAGGRDAEIFVLAIDDVEASIATAKMIKDKFPHLKIISRVRNRQHAIALMELGVSDIHRETLLTSLEVAKAVLLKMDTPEDQVDRQIRQFKARDQEILERQFELRHDEKKMISYTAKANQELEAILREDSLTGGD